MFLNKRPEKIDFSTKLDNGWFGVTITSYKKKKRAAMLREHLHGGHFYVTFESMFDDIKEADRSGIEWIVSDTEIGDEKEICFKAQWAQYLIDRFMI